MNADNKVNFIPRKAVTLKRVRPMPSEIWGTYLVHVIEASLSLQSYSRKYGGVKRFALKNLACALGLWCSAVID